MQSTSDAFWDTFTATQQMVIRTLLLLPLASAAELAALIGQSPEGVFRTLKRLSGFGVITSVRLGCLVQPVERWAFTPLGRGEFSPSGTDWQQPGCLARLLERITSVEHLYAAAARIRDLGAFREWQWCDGVSLDAAVRYDHGWAVLFWVGLLRSESRLAELIETVGDDLETLAYDDPHPRPGLLCFVVLRQWQVEMVIRVARRFGIEDWVRVWCAEGNTWHGATDCLASRGWIRQPAYRRTMSQRAWETRYANSLWAPAYLRDPVRLVRRVWKTIMPNPRGDDDDARRLRALTKDLRDLYGDEETRKNMTPRQMILGVDRLRTAASIIEAVTHDIEQERPGAEAAALLRRVASFLKVPGRYKNLGHLLLLGTEFSGCTVAMGQVVLGEGPGDRGVQHTVALLRDFGLMSSWKDGKKSRFRVTREAFNLLATMDRTKWDEPWRRLEMARWNNLGKVQKHEHGLLDLVGELMVAGYPVAPGWHAWEYLGDEGGIKPDAAVYLKDGPFGARWYHLEYELSARSLKRIRRKLRGFNSNRRENDWPLLVVCATDKAEKNFQEAATEMNIALATTTVGRLRKFGATHKTECWKVGDQQVALC